MNEMLHLPHSADFSGSLALKPLARWLRVMLAAVFFIVCGAAVPVSAQYRFDQWTTDTGLPQNGVRSILQTRDGYVWCTTFDGLTIVKVLRQKKLRTIPIFLTMYKDEQLFHAALIFARNWEFLENMPS